MSLFNYVMQFIISISLLYIKISLLHVFMLVNSYNSVLLYIKRYH